MRKIADSCFIVSVAENVLNVLPCHQAKINELKQNGFKIIGYCRKSAKQHFSTLQSVISVMMMFSYYILVHTKENSKLVKDGGTGGLFSIKSKNIISTMIDASFELVYGIACYIKRVFD